MIYDKQEIAKGFNDFFVNIGPELANKIVIPENNDVLQYMSVEMLIQCFYIMSIKRKCWML